MVFDPLSVVSGIGFGFSALSFLSNTVSTLIRQKREARECQTLLDAHKDRLWDCYLQICRWNSVWYGDSQLSEETYLYCWGPEGYDIIKRRITAIDDLIANILAHLRLNSFNFSRLDWNAAIQDREHYLKAQPQHANYFKKIAFAIHKNAQLSEEISRLRSAVEGLNSFSRSLFRDRQGEDIECTPTREELRSLEYMKFLMTDFSEFASDLYNAQKQYGEAFKWDLELRTPDWDGDLRQNATPGSISIDFCVEGRCSCRLWTAQRLRVHYRSKYSSNPNCPVGRIVEDALKQLESCSNTLFLSTSQLRVLEAPQSKGRPITRLLNNGSDYAMQRKAYEEERTTAALGFANWLFLLWRTPWVSEPCLCRVRRMKYGVFRGQYSYLLESSPATHIDSSCFSSDFSEQKLLLLGRAIAELALAQPIRMLKNPDGQKHFLKGDQTFTREELLQELRCAVGNNGLVQAFYRCLESEDQGADIRVERLHKNANNILQPIMAYHEVLKEHAKSQAGRRWRQRVEQFMKDNEDKQQPLLHHEHKQVQPTYVEQYQNVEIV